MSSREEKFLAISLDPKSVTQILKNEKLCVKLEEVLIEGDIKETDKNTGNLLYSVASKMHVSALAHRKIVVVYIKDGKLTSTPQVDAAMKFAKKFATAESLNMADFEKDTGVGVSFTDEEIVAGVQKVVQEHSEMLKEKRYRGAGIVLGAVNRALKWGNGKLIKTSFDDAILNLLGPKTEADTAKVKTKKVKVPKNKEVEEKKEVAEEPDDFLTGRAIPEATNTEEQLKKHLEFTQGKMYTRFPPEPNGFLHIGHAKAMHFNFGIAKKKNGFTYMRFDDTNPEAEKKLYIDSILENINWMGHEPWKITYSSDYFEELYQLAIKLIKKGKAYVCHQTGEEIEECRKNKTDSPYRTRSVEVNLKLFEDMRKGKYPAGGATLRMIGDMKHPNPQMWDIIAYRIKYVAHPHVGSKWCIYPSYDYTHCIVDSLENITHSLCTLEFEVRRESYYWLLWELDLYKPNVWEYSRLNIEHNVLSKRRLLKLVQGNHVRGWDDPRMLTINGLRRRGFTSKAITNFCESLGVTRNANMIPRHTLDFFLREDLNTISKRTMAVLDPIKVTITNFPEGKDFNLTALDNPQTKGEDLSTHPIALSNVVYISQADFKKEDVKKYFGLAPGKEVHLKNAFNITCNDFKCDENGKVTEINATADFDNKNKPKGKIHWVSSAPGTEVAKIEVRLYDYLFLAKDPMEFKDYLSNLNPESEIIVEGLCDPSLLSAKPGDKYQFERVGYFVCDQDSTKSKLVFNRACELKSRKK